MITLKESNAKLGHYTAATLGRMMVGKLSQHSKAYDQLKAILIPAYYQRWDNWTGMATPAAEPGADGAAAPAPTAALQPIDNRLLAMIEDVQQQLSQQLGHRMDHHRKAESYQGINSDTGKPYLSPSGVMDGQSQGAVPTGDYGDKGRSQGWTSPSPALHGRWWKCWARCSPCTDWTWEL